MTYTVWIKVENDDVGPGRDEAWWSVSTWERAGEAIDEAEEICAQYIARTGVVPQRLSQLVSEKEET